MTRAHRRLRLLVLALLAPALAWAAGLVAFALTLPRPTELDRGVEAVIVFTGGDGRLMRAARLYRESGAKALLVSGVHRDVRPADLEAVLPAGGWTLGYEAQDTEGNAREASAWIAGRGVRRVALVTGATHMRRAVLELRLAAPAAEILPVAVDDDGSAGPLWPPETLLRTATEYSKYLVVLAKAALTRLETPAATALTSLRPSRA